MHKKTSESLQTSLSIPTQETKLLTKMLADRPVPLDSKMRDEKKKY